MSDETKRCEACKGSGRCSDMRCWCLTDICAYCGGTGRSRRLVQPVKVWRCQCSSQCDGDDSCWSDVTQEDALCDWCRRNCAGTQERKAGPVAASGVNPDLSVLGDVQ